MSYDAVILAGGRSLRLGGQPKARLEIGGRSLLELTLDAVRDAAAIVVVGEPDLGRTGVLTVREDPPFAGPAAAIAVGLDALPPASDIVIVLACDMPAIGFVVPILVAGIEAVGGPDTAGAEPVDGLLALDGDRAQFLASVFRRDALDRAVAAQRASSTLRDLSVKALVSTLRMGTLRVPDGGTRDVDTWADAAVLGIDGALAPDSSPTAATAATAASTDRGGER